MDVHGRGSNAEAAIKSSRRFANSKRHGGGANTAILRGVLRRMRGKFGLPVLIISGERARAFKCNKKDPFGS